MTSAVALDTLGFDTRVSAGVHKQLRNDSIIGHLAKLRPASPDQLLASADPEVWVRVEESSSVELSSGVYRNGFGLLHPRPISAADPLYWVLSQQSPFLQIAFVVEPSIVESLGSTFGPVSTELLRNTNELCEADWTCIGFDVVDVRTMMSFLTSFCWDEKEISEFTSRVAKEINLYGLFSEFSDASQYASDASSRLPEHAPFCATGIWLDGDSRTKGVNSVNPQRP
jgi:hypothetical protein